MSNDIRDQREVWCCHFLSQPGCLWIGPGVVTADGVMLCKNCAGRLYVEPAGERAAEDAAAPVVEAA